MNIKGGEEKKIKKIIKEGKNDEINMKIKDDFNLEKELVIIEELKVLE